jgi:glycosyltransferase involved in cell wall biosynthesis
VKRVLLATASAVPGGAEGAFASLVELLPAHGWEPLPVLLADGPLRTWLEPNVTVLDAGRTRQLTKTVGAIRALARIARDNDVQAVVSCLSKSHVYGGAAAALARIPAVWWQLDNASGSLIERIAARVPAARVVCVSEASAAAQRRFTPGKPVSVIYCGTSVHDPATVVGTGAEIRAAQGWGDNTVVGIVGRLEPWKGQAMFLEAAALVARELPGTRFAVIGGAILGWEGTYPDELRELARTLGIADTVLFAGHQANVLPWYDALDVVVHASAAEPFGRVLVEAMALGKPLVTVAEGAGPEIVEDGDSGIVVERSPRALADGIMRIARDPGLAAKIGSGAVTRAAVFSPERAAAEFASVLDSLEPHPRRSARRFALARRRAG